MLKAAFENWNYGDPENPANLQGPQISKRQQERVLGYIEKGKQEGARCSRGWRSAGGRDGREGLLRGAPRSSSMSIPIPPSRRRRSSVRSSA